MLSLLVIWPSIIVTVFVIPFYCGVVQLVIYMTKCSAVSINPEHVLLQISPFLINCSVFCVFPGFS